MSHPRRLLAGPLLAVTLGACEDHAATVLGSQQEAPSAGAGRGADDSTGGEAGIAGAGGAGGTGGVGGAGGAGTSCDEPPCEAWGARSDGSYRNPVLWSEFSNVDVTQVASEFYMVASPYHYLGVPVLHSRDLVNWQFIARLSSDLGGAERYASPGLAYQDGVWAATLRHREGEFLIYATTLGEGLLLASASAAEGPWSAWQRIHAASDWQDPDPFWDDVPSSGGDGPDGRQAYLLRSKFEGSLVQLHRMSWDGRSLLDSDGIELASGSVFRAPRLIKHEGSYFLFVAQGPTSSGQQAVFRADSIEGPYEKRVILERGSSGINGPHIGSWLELETGGSWFVHNQFAEGWGGVVHLEPAGWDADGWPTVGVDEDGDGIGEPVREAPGPIPFSADEIVLPASTDSFAGPELGLQWAWNHEPVAGGWSLTARPGWLRLEALPLATESGETPLGNAVEFAEDDLRFAYDVLVQNAMGRRSSGTTLLDTQGMVEGQRAGLAFFGQEYAWVGVVVSEGRRRVMARLIDGSVLEGPVLGADTVWLRGSMSERSEVGLAYSLDGESFTALGEEASVGRTYFQAIKYALFTYHLSTAGRGGTADFDSFVLRNERSSGQSQ